MAATAASDATDGPVMSLINKRLRALRKKHNRIIQMEESIAQGKTLNKEQEEVLRSKPTVVVLIEELEKLRSPISAAVSEETNLAIQRHQVSSDQTTVPDNDDDGKYDTAAVPQDAGGDDGAKLEDLMNLLYFGSLFDVKSQNEFASIMLTRTHERGCCLTYDYVTDDATDLLGERDLDLISRLGSLMISRPVDSSLSHKNALERCIEHAKLWLANSDQPIEPNANVSYAGLREKLKKIMASDYFTTTPEMKAPVEVAAAAGNYVSFQVNGVPVGAPIEVEGSAGQYQQKEEDTSNLEGHEAVDDHQSPPVDENQKDDMPETEEAQVPAEVAPEQQEQVVHTQTEPEHTQRDSEHREQQYVPRRSYQNQRGGRGGGRRGYSNGRGGRGGGGRGGGYQNGRSQYYDQSGGNYYQRNYYNSSRGRGGGRGGGGGGHSYNHHGSAAAQKGGRGSSDVGVASA